MRKFETYIGTYTTDAAAISTAATYAAGEEIPRNGALASGGVATLQSQQTINITSAGDDTDVLFEIVGTTDSGAEIRETLAGSNASSVNSVLAYKTITYMSASAATTSVQVGTGAGGFSAGPWLILPTMIRSQGMTYTLFFETGTTGSIAMQATTNDLMRYRDHDGGGPHSNHHGGVYDYVFAPLTNLWSPIPTFGTSGIPITATPAAPSVGINIRFSAVRILGAAVVTGTVRLRVEGPYV
jgi:hypothetical protein